MTSASADIDGQGVNDVYLVELALNLRSNVGLRVKTLRSASCRASHRPGWAIVWRRGGISAAGLS